MTNPHDKGRKRTRFDAPHPTLSDEPAAAPIPETSRQLVGVTAGAGQEQLERHAFDLGQQLQQQQRDLDRREAEFNARVGEAEHELRVTRLAVKERLAELAEREYELEQSELEAQTLLNRGMREDNSAATESHFAHVDTQRQSQELKLALESWRRRLRELEDSERHLQSQIAQLAYDRQQLEQQRSQEEQSISDLIQRVVSERRDERARFEQQLLGLGEREQEVDRRELAVEQLHADVSRMYREAIEIRLCTQQQWAAMNESVSQAELSHELARLRRKLMEQFQLGENRVDQQRREIESMLVQLNEHRQSVEQQRSEVREWVMRRHEEIEADAARVLEREQELNRQLSEHRFVERQWAEQRAGYEQEIRRLRRLVKSD